MGGQQATTQQQWPILAAVVQTAQAPTVRNKLGNGRATVAAPIYNFFLWCTWPHPRAPTVQPCRAGSTRPAGQPNCLLIIWEHPFQTLAPTLQATPTSALPTCTTVARAHTPWKGVGPLGMWCRFRCTGAGPKCPTAFAGPLEMCGAVSGALGQGPTGPPLWHALGGSQPLL